MKSHLFTSLLLSAALGLAACSSDQEAISDGSKSPLAQGGYLKLAVNLPAQRTTRADNDSFDDGKDSEYKVNTAKLFLFTGNTEQEAVFHSAYDLNTDATVYNDSPNQITCVIPVEKNVPENIQGSKIYAAVVLNDNGNILISADNLTAVLYLKAGDEFNFKGHTLKDFQSLSFYTSIEQATTKGIVMMNAPLATVQGGTNKPADVTYITFPDATQTFYTTIDEAKVKPATEIFVERLVAKVTVQGTSGTVANNNIVQTGADGTSTVSADPVKWKVLGWHLDITNRKSHFIRNTLDHATWDALRTNDASITAPYRFVGSATVKSGLDTPLYRTYWAKDPNYDTYAYDDFIRLKTGDVIDDGSLGDDNPQYCFDNTFDVANMNQDRTTRAVLKVQIGNGETLYTIHSDNNHVYNEAALKAHVKLHIAEYAPIVNLWKAHYAGKTAPHATPTVDDVDYTFYYAPEGEEHAGYVTALILKYTDDGTETTDTISNTTTDKLYLNNQLGIGGVLRYANGVAYYGVRIKHFGDELTPWRAGETPAVTTGNIYPADNADANYLGRYSVLRNNWYDIKVTGIREMGSTIIPPPSPNIPDDEYYEYVEVTSKVRNWIRRDQGADL